VGPRILTYRNDVTHLIGEQFECPRFMLNGGIRTVRWVVTNATYYPEWNKTFVELDVSA
jgi:hypothetical protein